MAAGQAQAAQARPRRRAKHQHSTPHQAGGRSTSTTCPTKAISQALAEHAQPRRRDGHQQTTPNHDQHGGQHTSTSHAASVAGQQPTQRHSLAKTDCTRGIQTKRGGGATGDVKQREGAHHIGGQKGGDTREIQTGGAERGACGSSHQQTKGGHATKTQRTGGKAAARERQKKARGGGGE